MDIYLKAFELGSMSAWAGSDEVRPIQTNRSKREQLLALSIMPYPALEIDTLAKIGLTSKTDCLANSPADIVSSCCCFMNLLSRASGYAF